ncbi:hypothetical protein ACHQM5_009730 [Ranunculus cassubicifolius]
MVKSFATSKLSLAFSFALFLFIFASLDIAIIVAETKQCKAPSGAFTGWCFLSSECEHTCSQHDGKDSGKCSFKFPSRRCICYWNC